MEGKPADWRGPQSEQENSTSDISEEESNEKSLGTSSTAGAYIASGAQTLGKELGLRKDKPESVSEISRASSVVDLRHVHDKQNPEDQPPYPGVEGTEAQKPTSAHLLTTSPSGSVSASGFGRGAIKSSEIKTAEKEAAHEESDTAKISDTKATPLDTNTENQRDHNPPLSIRDPDGKEDRVTYDDEDDEDDTPTATR